MANLTLTPANIVLPTTNEILTLDASVSGLVTTGTVLVKNASGYLVKAQATSADLAGITAGREVYIAASAAYAGQPILVIRTGDVTIGATVAPNVAYVISATAGLICPVADLTTGQYAFFIGMGISTTQIRLLMKAGVVTP